jgi:hypothetical protein
LANVSGQSFQKNSAAEKKKLGFTYFDFFRRHLGVLKSFICVDVRGKRIIFIRFTFFNFRRKIFL